MEENKMVTPPNSELTGQKEVPGDTQSEPSPAELATMVVKGYSKLIVQYARGIDEFTKRPLGNGSDVQAGKVMVESFGNLVSMSIDVLRMAEEYTELEFALVEDAKPRKTRKVKK